MPLPTETLLRVQASPVPTHTVCLLVGSSATAPIDCTGCLSNFGVTLVRTALALLSFSVRGLSDVEMTDLLSLHDAALDEVFQYAKPEVRRLPSHVWLRLRAAMDGLVDRVRTDIARKRGGS